MSKAPDSPPRSRTRSRTRSRSRSYSRSHSRSRSRSRSRKRRYSSRSRSRSRSHSPHRNYPSRDYQNNRGNYRGYNRGYRRPFQYRGRNNRGFFPRGRYQNRGGNNYGYRANNWQDDGGGGGGRGGGRGGGGGGNWHDQDHHHHHQPPQPHSPRRGRSRTPRKRSGSRSRSRYSDRSSSAAHSRHSRRSSYSSRSPSPRHRKGGNKGKPGAKEPKEKAGGEGPPEAREKSQERPDGSSIEKVAGGKWIDYDTSPKAAGAKEDAGGSGSKGPLWRTVGDDPPPKDTSKSPPRAGQTATFGGFGFFSKEDPKAGDKTGITSAFKKFLAENKSADKDLDRQERDPEKSSGGSSKAGSAYSLPASGASFREAKEEKVLPFFAAGEEEFLKAHGMKDSGEGLGGGGGGGAKPQSALSTREMFGKWEEETGYPTSYPLPAKEKSRREAAAAAAAAGGEAEPEESVYRSRKHKKEEKAKKKEKKEKEKEREKSRRSPSPMPLPPPLHRGSKSQERDRPPLFPAAMAAGDGSPASRMSITRADFEQKMSAMDEMPGSSLPIERRASRELGGATAAAAAIAPPKKDSEFRSVFNQMQLAQLRQSPSDLFAQHIVTIVHYIKAQHFRSSDMSLSERFAIYQRKAAEVEMMKPRKSPEIHRRIDLSPSAFKRHSHLFEDVEETSYKDPNKKVKGDVMDLRLDIERRKRFAGKESKRDGAKSSGGSRGPSRERSSEKAGKHHKKSKKSKKKRDRSPSSSSSSSSPSPYPPPFRGKDYGGEPPGAPGDHMEEGYGHGRYPPRDYAGPMDRGPRDYEGHNMDRGRGRGFFPRVRGRGWNRGGYPGNNNNNNSSNGNPANNMNPPVRPPDEEWDPEYTPKSRKYYLHDDRDGEKGWVDTRGRGRGGPFPARRGRFVYRKGGASPKWTHDMFQGGEEGELADDTMELEHKESKAEPAAPK